MSTVGRLGETSTNEQMRRDLRTTQTSTAHPNGGGPGETDQPKVKRAVFIPAVVIILVALAVATWIGAVYGENATETFTEIREWIGTTVGWWYILVVTCCLIFAFWAAFSKIGRVRLGRDDERPEFSRMSWFAMLFSAGMGIGLVFNGVAEPLTHLVAPPEVIGDEASSSAAAKAAVGEAMFHWGLHAWGIYAIVGLGLAYMTYRYGRPLSVRWLLEPLMGRRLIESWVGHVIDTVAIIGTVFGVATSLGMGGGPADPGGTGASGMDRAIEPLRHHPRRRHHRDRHALGRVRCGQGNPLAVEHQYGNGRPPRPGRAHHRPHDIPAAFDGSEHRRVRPDDPPAGLRHRGRCRRRLDSGLDTVQPGVVPVVGSLRRHVHRPHLARTHDPRVHP